MSIGEQALAIGPAGAARRGKPPKRGHLHRTDLVWTLAFLAPYAALLVGFAAYPIAYGLWMGSDPALYRELATDPLYRTAVVNTVLFTGLAVNAQMLLALFLSGFFARRRRWIRIVLIVFILPWTLPAVPAFLSFHWMLVADQQGLLDGLLSRLFGIGGPNWLDSGWLALLCDGVAYVWKWLPLWTLILLAGRMAIPDDLYEAAAVDGAGVRDRFIHVTAPLLANLYLISTLISAVWTIGDYAPVYFVSGGAPAMSSQVLSTLGFHYALDFGNPRLGVAAGLSTLPVLLPIVVLLMRRLRFREVQL